MCAVCTYHTEGIFQGVNDAKNLDFSWENNSWIVPEGY